MTQIIDLLLTAPDEAQTLAMLDGVGWVGKDEDEKAQIQPPFRCSAMPITLWRSLPQFDDEGKQIEAGEQTPGFWLGLCIPDSTLLDQLWKLPGVVAALDRESSKVLRLKKGFSLKAANGLVRIHPFWSGSQYPLGALQLKETAS